MNLDKIRQGFTSLADENEWHPMHSPKNLVMALAVEVGELLEHFQWLDDQASRDLKNIPTDKAEVADEMADVFMYLLALADKLDIDLQIAAETKMEKLLQRFNLNQQ